MLAQQSEKITQMPNPQGVDGFAFVEYAAKDVSGLERLMQQFGFTAVAKHKDLDSTLYRQGDINFVITAATQGFAESFSETHGPCCPGFALQVEDAKSSLRDLKAKGAEEVPAGGRLLDGPAIYGIGGAILYLTDSAKDIEEAFEPIAGVDQNPKGFGLTFIDHLTHNVIDGNMDKWAGFYREYFGFFEVKYFDIKGSQTGLRSRAMTAPHGRISIPINESSDPKSQINEYINEYNGEGVQHIALHTDDIYATVESMREQGVQFLDTPDTYYDVVNVRVPEHDEDLDRMRKNKILIDADQNQTEQQLLQIFTETNIGPLFFEIIQRKGNKGFGEGNFQALFEAIERDQERRGVL